MHASRVCGRLADIGISLLPLEKVTLANFFKLAACRNFDLYKLTYNIAYYGIVALIGSALDGNFFSNNDFLLLILVIVIVVAGMLFLALIHFGHINREVWLLECALRLTHL